MAIAEMAAGVAVATAYDAERLVRTMTRALVVDPVIRWLYPGRREFQDWWPEMMRLSGAGARAHGTAFVADGGAVVAFWLPPGASPDEEALGALVRSSVAEDRQPETFAFLEQMGLLHPVAPHWYPAFIGVDPSTRRRATARRCCAPRWNEATSMACPLAWKPRPRTAAVFTSGTASAPSASSRPASLRPCGRCCAPCGDPGGCWVPCAMTIVPSAERSVLARLLDSPAARLVVAPSTR